MKRRQFSRLLAGSGSLLAAPGIVRAQGQNGVALVIGNSKYKWEASLPNVKRDAPDVAKAFQALGLKTEFLQDVGRDALRGAVEKFGAASRGAKLAAFYFAGHGVFWEKQTYVVPANADLADPKSAKSLMPVGSISEATKDAAAQLLVFDSCRNNPADGWRQREARAMARGDAIDNAALAASRPNTLVLFSTAPGGIALDGPAGENSPFAGALLRQLAGQTVDLQALPAKVRRDLLLATECRQMVWEQSTFAAPVLIDGRAAAVAGVRYDPSRIVELPNVYTFARENGLVLPPGLVAYRPASSMPEVQRARVGAYRHDLAILGGGGVRSPMIVIVLSIPDGKSAEIVQSAKNIQSKVGGTRWRYTTATHAEDGIVLLTVDEQWRNEYKWRDQNSGSFTASPASAANGGRIQTHAFTRLDG